MKRRIFSVLFALMLVLSMSVIPGAPVGANGGSAPTLDSFEVYCYDDQNEMSFDNLYGVVEFVWDAADVDDDLCYLEINLHPCGETCANPEDKPMIQLDVCADEDDIFQDCMTDCANPVPWTDPQKHLAEAMGVDLDNSYYDADEMAWHLVVDLTKVWSPEGATIYEAAYEDIGADVEVGAPVFPKCCIDGEYWGPYQMCYEIGDAEGNQYGDLSSCTDCQSMDFYGMHLLSPNEFDAICTGEGESVTICWNFHADCTDEEDFLIEIYDPDTRKYAAWPGYFTVTGTTPCQCYTHCVDVPLKAIVDDGKYNVKITSTCDAQCTMDCKKWVEEEDAVIVDSIDPEVDVVAADATWNYNDCDNFTLKWDMSDNTGVTKVKIEFSKDSGSTWSELFYGDPEDAKIHWDDVNENYYTDIHVGTGGSADFDLTPDGIEACQLAHLRVTAEDCGGNTGSDETGAFTIDNTLPVVTVVSPNGGEKWEGCTLEDIVWTVVENCGPLSILIEFSDNCSDTTPDWKTVDEGALTSPYSWHVDPTVNSDDCCIRITATDCPGNTGSDDSDEPFEITSPPMLFDAITGWTWDWESTDNPVNSNTPTSIMVVFNKELDLDTVQISDFKVMNPTKAITDMEVHTYHSCEEWKGWTTVFLTVSPIMKTYETPTVQIIGEIKDTDGIALLDKLPEGAPNGLPPYQEVVCQDGIAPLIEVTANPAEPGYNEMVTITIQASEKLSEAYLFVGSGSPQDYTWNTCKPIGWPPAPPHELPEAWYGKNCDGGKWLAPPEALVLDPLDPTGKRWTAEFRCKFGPDDPWFVEAAAHDFTEWEVFPWKHEKWTEESIKFHAVEYVKIYLYEGWNLISVPRELTDPSVAGFFGTRFSGVTKVYNWDGSRWNGSVLDPAGTWIKVIGYGVTTIEPGKGYWVWCSPPKVQLIMTVVEPDPLVVPPAYSLVKGWNLIGFTALDYPLQYRSMAKYLFSLCDVCKLVYWYSDQVWYRVTPTADWWPSCKDRAKPGYGYWLYLAKAGTLAP